MDMPFEKVDRIAEAVELQELFKDDPEAKEMFKQYELAHRENERLEQEETELRNRLIKFRKQKNIRALFWWQLLNLLLPKMVIKLK